MKLKSIIMSAAVASSFYGLAASAQFTSNEDDLFAAFRTAGGATNIVVDIGSASVYQNAVGSFTLADVNSALLTSVFGSTDGIYWSVFGGLTSSGSLGAAHTIWVTSPRPDALTQTDPWQSSNFSGQGGVVSPIDGIANGAAVSPALSSTVALVNSSLNNGNIQISYTIGIGPASDFTGAWRGDIENFTGVGFASSGSPSVSDLYQQNPGLANFGNYLGNFSLGNDGSLVFNSVTPVPEPNTLAMFGAGIMSLFAVRRFRKS